MTTTAARGRARSVAAAIGVLFGLATLVAGGGVLLGADPGYQVYRPLLVYNTGMGAAYLAAGIGIWGNRPWGTYAAGAIALANAVVLVSVIALHRSGAGVAEESVRAMTLRTVVWVVIAIAVGRARPPGRGPTATVHTDREAGAADGPLGARAVCLDQRVCRRLKNQ